MPDKQDGVDAMFGKLWYFVMDECPEAFERIVTTYPSARWMDEAHKLYRAKYPL